MPSRNTEALDLNLVRALCVLLRCRSVSLAAEELGITQGAMSKILGRLRSAFGDPLFTRTLRGFEPTRFALEFAPVAERAIADLEAGARRAAGFDAPHTARAFSILVSDIGQSVFLPHIVERVEREAPGVSIVAANIDRADQYDALQTGAVDLAIGNFPHFGRELRQRWLFDETFVGLVNQRNPLARGPLTREAYQSARHAVVSPWGQDTAYEDMFLRKLGAPRHVVVRVPSFLALVEIIARSDLVATIPSRAAKLARGRGVVELEVPIKLPTIPVKLFWHERAQRDAGSLWLRKLMLELFHLTDRLD